MRKEDIKYCKYIINKKEANNKELNNTELLLKKHIKLYNDSKAMILLGKLYLKEKKLLHSKVEFNQAKKINDKEPSIYYGLFKINILEKNYKSAKNNLNQYENLIEEKYPSNLSGYYLLLDILNDEKTENIKLNKIINNQIIKDSELLIHYNKFIKLSLNNNFNEALQEIKKCKKISEDKNICLEFHTYELLLNKIIEKQSENFIISKSLKKLSVAKKENNKNEYIKQINMLFNNNYASIDFYLKECNKLVDIDLYLAKDFLKKIIEKNTNNKSLNKIEYIKNKIQNKEQYNKYTEQDRELINYYINSAKEYIEQENYEYALYTYEAGLYITKNNIFNYYIGKTYYKLENYKISNKYLLKYNEKGTEKLEKSTLYICMINSIFNNKKNNKKILDNLKQLSYLEDFSFELDELYDDFNEDYDKSRKVLSKINLTEEDFMKQS